MDVAGVLERIEHKLDHALLDSRQYNVATTEVVHINHHHHHYHYHKNITNITNITNKNEKEKEKDLFERDRHDYALITNGARIEDSSKTYCINTRERGGGHSSLCKNTPAHILAPDGAAAVRPGECWGLAGSSGFVVIRLREAVVPRAVAVVHPTRGDISGAPREFRVYGVDSPDGNNYEGTLLGSFVYDARSPEVAQEFALREQGAAFRYVRVEIVSNWGNSAWTCLYKVKLFGSTI